SHRDSQSKVSRNNTRYTGGSVGSSEYSQPSQQVPDYKSASNYNYDASQSRNSVQAAGQYRTGSQVDQYGSFDVYNDFNNVRHSPDDFDERHATTRMSSSGLNDKDLRDPLYSASSNLDSGGQGGIIKTNSNQVNPESLAKPKKRKSCCCCSRRTCVFITFFVLLALGITLFFVWPRIPDVKILGASSNGQPTISVSPPIVKMDFNISIEIDNPDNWIPIRFNRIDAQVFDLSTISTYDHPIAYGNLTNYALPPRQTTILQFPLTVDYIGKDINDPTVQDFLLACLPQQGAKANTLNIRADITLYPWGISWIFKPTISRQISDLVGAMRD
ncbi:4164_t:CDS:2, partial [Ambispora leptoticha]